jgi:4-amino-4-deoxy-L-arabinose transferase-like glycosyltransferase
LVVACYILGRLLIPFFADASGQLEGDWLSLAFASLTLGITLIGWLGLILAEVGWFSIELLAAVWLAAILILASASFRRRRQSQPARTSEIVEQLVDRFNLPGWVQYVLLIGWLVAASWLFFRPHEYVLGAADAGVYVNLAANINKTGKILIDDPALADLDPALYPALLRQLPPQDQASSVAPYYIFPGFYVTSSPVGRITPQFYPLHAVWQAIAFGMANVKAALLMTGLWAVLGSLAVYLSVRRIAGWEAAFFGLLGLTINALQVWFARYPTTEALTQFLLWTAIWSLMTWLKGEKPLALWGFLAGVTLGEVFLTRIDTYFLLALPIGIFLWLHWSGRWRRQHLWFFGPVTLLTIHSFLHAWQQSRPYFVGIFAYGLRLLERNWMLLLFALIICIAILIFVGRHHGQLNQLGHYKIPLLWVAALIVLLLVAYGYFIRPDIGLVETTREYWYGGEQIPAGLDKQNLVRLGWYLTPFSIALATAGICLMLLEINRQTVVIIFVGLLFSLLYLWRIQANPHQIYTMRRYVPVVLPFAMVAIAYFLGWLFQSNQRWIRLVGIMLGLAWLFMLGFSAKEYIKQVDYAGILAQLENLDKQLEKDSVLIFNDSSLISQGDLLGTPLRFLFGHDVFTLRHAELLDEVAFRKTIEGWLANGRQVYWIGDPEVLSSYDLDPGSTVQATISSYHLEASYDKKPEQLANPIWILDITVIQ